MKIDWNTGVPSLADIYLVAIKLGDNGGYFAFAYWNGQQWDQSWAENVIAWRRAGDLIQMMNIEWPEPDFVEPDDLGEIPRGIDQYEE